MKTEFMDLSRFDLTQENITLQLDRAQEGSDQKGYVPAYHFYIIDKNTGKKAGRCDLRLGHNERLYYGGNIGYTVFPDFRGDHFAQKACRVLFKLAKAHEMEYVLITCDPDNIASRKTLEGLDGELLGVYPLPDWHDMYKAGHLHTCILKFKI